MNNTLLPRATTRNGIIVLIQKVASTAVEAAYPSSVTQDMLSPSFTFVKLQKKNMRLKSAQARMGARSEAEAGKAPFRNLPMRRGEVRGGRAADPFRLLLLHELPRSWASV